MKRELYFQRIRKAYYLIVALMVLSLGYAIAFSIYQKSYFVLLTSVLTLILIFLPFFIKRLKIYLPTEIELVAILFIYASLFLGEVHSFYFRFWWWDIFLHGLSAVSFGFIGFTVLYFMVNRHELDAKSWAIAVFTFSFVIAIGSLWEIFEFSMDTFFGLNMQKSGLLDTMGDLIVDALGALFASFIGFFYLKTKKTILFRDSLKNSSR